MLITADKNPEQIHQF
ncbi:hypothetical protein CGLO_12346 [Colletotrichum gloeosporioides Cg-14]|uniref:Uncharacterized protein n=1 Tax=Colletotrichum gloeosporioides (strain Cg-14) TaxID=1237896 RepID=T0K628_COLGC|nr:hypothetical protein CGLO_12346 [Colletotrichum gloeosporioides Cg-14]